MKLSENALVLLKERYLNDGETPEDLFRRVSDHLLPGNKELLDMMMELKFLPNSPTLMNAGNELGQLSACFVIPVEDSIDSIFDAVKLAAKIHKTGGGTGFDFSPIRPAGSRVNSTSGVASGPVSFMQVFDSATGAIKQGGRRRGANMGILRIDHPDILEFIRCKSEDGKISNFNISVTVTDEFMEKARRNENYRLIDHKGEKVKELSAAEVLDLVAEQAWKNGEPGIVFIDRINQFNPVPKVGKITATNPCGEQPLLPYESCNLGSINVSRFVKNGRIDWVELKKCVRLATRALDSVIDKNKFPAPEIAEMTRRTRKIGLGIMGFADLLLRLKIRYGSAESLRIARILMRTINIVSKLESIELAKKYGPFPAFHESSYMAGILPTKWQNKRLAEKIIKHGIRNATTTTIAPTGSLSFIAGCSSGIEPIFSYVLVKNVLGGKKFIEVNEVLKELCGEVNENINPKDYGDYFISAHEVSVNEHVMMQSTFQEFVDNAISKTINFPAGATKEDVKKAIWLAYESGCKGITVYRDGSRQNQVLSRPKTRDESLNGRTTKVKLGCNRNIYVTVNREANGKINEVFLVTGKSGGCITSLTEAIGRMVSTALRSGIEPAEIVKQLKGIRCQSQTIKALSCADAVAKVLEKEIGISVETVEIAECPECGSRLVEKEGCQSCEVCGYGKCG